MSDFSLTGDGRGDGLEADLEAGLAAGFGRQRVTVLHAIERAARTPLSRVSLRDPVRGPESPVAKPFVGAAAPATAGKTNYQLQGEIARGGMGVLIKGHDLDLGREVALKVLREDLAARPEIVQRFVEEAQIGGQLQHPGIVPVYELGLMADQRPYFAMKLVRGRTLAAALADRDAADRRKLLDVFASVCQTMAYAHSRGVVHRDLKPANVLIGAFGEVQVIDWGLAKLLGVGGAADEARTRLARSRDDATRAATRATPSPSGSRSLAGSVMGTPAYMAPEQARGEIARIDERTDVFALGATLCEMLTGKPPYLGDEQRTVLQAAAAELDDARARLNTCDADAELVELCRDCLAPDQAQRPRSAELVSARMQAYLASLAERARNAELRAAEARVKARATTHVAAAGALTVLIASSTWLWWREDQSNRARSAERSVSASIADATIARGRSDWASAFAAVERARARLEDAPASEALREQVRALGEDVEREAGEARARTELAADNARLLAALEEARRSESDDIYVTDWNECDREFAAIFARHGVEFDETDVAGAANLLAERGLSVQLASALDEWASVRRNAGRSDAAQRLREVADRLDDDTVRRSLRAALFDGDVAALRRIAERGVEGLATPATIWLVAHALVQASEFELATQLLTQARRRFPQDFQLAIELARTLRRIDPPRYDEAVEHYQAALALRPERAAIWHDLGQTYSRLGRHDEALETFRFAVEHMPDDGHLHHHVGNALSNLGRHEEALESFDRAIELAPRFAPTHNDRGSSLEKLGRYDEALVSFERSLELDATRQLPCVNSAVAMMKLGDFERARERLDHCAEHFSEFADAWFWRGFCYVRLGRRDEAIEFYERCLELDPQFTEVRLYLGAALQQVQRYAEAVKWLAEAARNEPEDPRGHLYYAALLVQFGDADSDDGADGLEDARRALPHARRAIELGRATADAHEVLAFALYAHGEFEEALASVERAQEESGPKVQLRLLRALCLSQTRRLEDARDELEDLGEELETVERIAPALRPFVNEGRGLIER